LEKKSTGSELIEIYDKHKQNYFTKMQKALFPNERKKFLYFVGRAS